MHVSWLASTLRNKLKSCKLNLKIWNKMFGNMEFKIKSLVNKLELWELRVKMVGFTQEKLGFRSAAC